MAKVEVDILNDKVTITTTHMHPPTTLDPIKHKARKVLKREYNCYYKLKHIQSEYNITQGDINKFIGTHHFQILTGNDRQLEIWIEKVKIARPECFPPVTEKRNHYE